MVEKCWFDQRTAKEYTLADIKPKYVYKRVKQKVIEDYVDY